MLNLMAKKNTSDQMSGTGSGIPYGTLLHILGGKMVYLVDVAYGVLHSYLCLVPQYQCSAFLQLPYYGILHILANLTHAYKQF